MAYYSGMNFDPQTSPSAQGAPVNQMSNQGMTATNAKTGISSYDQNPGYLDSNPMTSTYQAIQQAPAWLQQQTQKQVIGQGQGGAYDPSLQLRDIYSQYQPGLQSAISQYGVEAVNNPYFVQNNQEFGKQTQGSFNPFSQNLYDYQVGNAGGDIYKTQRNPFTGELMGSGDFYGDFYKYTDTIGGKNQFQNEILPYLNDIGIGNINPSGTDPYKWSQYQNQYDTVEGNKFRRNYIYDQKGNVIGVR